MLARTMGETAPLKLISNTVHSVTYSRVTLHVSSIQYCCLNICSLHPEICIYIGGLTQSKIHIAHLPDLLDD